MSNPAANTREILGILNNRKINDNDDDINSEHSDFDPEQSPLSRWANRALEIYSYLASFFNAFLGSGFLLIFGTALLFSNELDFGGIGFIVGMTVGSIIALMSAIDTIVNQYRKMHSGSTPENAPSLLRSLFRNVYFMRVILFFQGLSMALSNLDRVAKNSDFFNISGKKGRILVLTVCFPAALTLGLIDIITDTYMYSVLMEKFSGKKRRGPLANFSSRDVQQLQNKFQSSDQSDLADKILKIEVSNKNNWEFLSFSSDELATLKSTLSSPEGSKDNLYTKITLPRHVYLITDLTEEDTNKLIAALDIRSQTCFSPFSCISIKTAQQKLKNVNQNDISQIEFTRAEILCIREALTAQGNQTLLNKLPYTPPRVWECFTGPSAIKFYKVTGTLLSFLFNILFTTMVVASLLGSLGTPLGWGIAAGIIFFGIPLGIQKYISSRQKFSNQENITNNWFDSFLINFQRNHKTAFLIFNVVISVLSAATFFLNPFVALPGIAKQIHYLAPLVKYIRDFAIVIGVLGATSRLVPHFKGTDNTVKELAKNVPSPPKIGIVELDTVNKPHPDTEDSDEGKSKNSLLLKK